MNYSEFYGTGDEGRRLKRILFAYDPYIAREFRNRPQQKTQLVNSFNSYVNYGINELKNFTESEESPSPALKMFSIIFKKHLNIAAKYEIINSAELLGYMETVNAFYVSQDMIVDDEYSSSQEIHNRIETSVQDMTGLRYFNPS